MTYHLNLDSTSGLHKNKRFLRHTDIQHAYYISNLAKKLNTPLDTLYKLQFEVASVLVNLNKSKQPKPKLVMLFYLLHHSPFCFKPLVAL